MMQPPVYPPYPPIRPKLESVFSRAWQLLRANWIIGAPPVIAVAVSLLVLVPAFVSLVKFSLANQGTYGGVPPTSTFVWVGVGYLIALVSALWALLAIFGMADAAWTRGTVTFGDGFRAFRSHLVSTISAGIGLFLVAIVAAILALPTIGLSLVAMTVFTMYVMPAVVSGNRGGFEAISESFRLVRRAFGWSAIGGLMLIALQYALSLAAYPVLFPVIAPFQIAAMSHPANPTLPALPPLPVLVASGTAFALIVLLTYAYYGFYALTVVGMYRALAFGEAGDAPDGTAPVTVATEP